MPRRYRRRGAATFVEVDRSRIDPAAELKTRLAERDRRRAADNRTEAEKWLGDPPPDRSALAAKR